jgi:transposase
MTDSDTTNQGGALRGGLRRLADPRNLGDRVARLEAEVDELQQLNLRLAELTDVVQELLLPLARQDPDKAVELLERYRDELGT